MRANPAIERVVRNILAILEQSKVENIEPIELPTQADDERNLRQSIDAETQFYSIDPAIYNIFKTVIKRFDRGFLIVLELISYPLDRGNSRDLEQLSNHLYEILKGYTVGRGRFNKTDAYQLNELKIWPGKLWVDQKTASIVSLNMFDGITRLTIINGGTSDGA